MKQTNICNNGANLAGTHCILLWIIIPLCFVLTLSVDVTALFTVVQQNCWFAKWLNES